MNKSEQRQLAVRCKLFAATVFLCSCLTGISQTNSFFQFVQSQSERHYSNVPHEVLADYYVWFGAESGIDAWKKDTNGNEVVSTADYPVKGAYSSHDTNVMAWHIQQAKAHGVTGFVVSWFGFIGGGTWLNEALALLLKEAEKEDFKIAVYWETAPGDGDYQTRRAIDELSYVLERYGKSKAYLKVDGKPVIFVYWRVIGQVPYLSWPKIIQETRAKSGDFILDTDCYESRAAYLYDGLHTYPLNDDPTADKPKKLRDWVKQYYAHGIQQARRRGRISCVTVTPGFEQLDLHAKVDRRNGERYRTQWQEAVKAKPDWILITSWNEWSEGTEIEPSRQYGDAYLQITAEYAKPFLDSPTVAVPPPTNNLPQVAPGTTNRLDTLLAGRKCGVLIQDGMNESDFWAAYCGATLERLTTTDLIDPKVFNASNFPVFIYVAGEHFVSSVKVTDDLTQSLIRYLHQGGFLMVLPNTGTWPLYYDDSRKGVQHAITDTLAMGIDSGFDTPADAAESNFYVNKKALLGLPSPVPFPKTGDTRFRPANHARASATDYYLPLVQVWDGHRHLQGDAAVYIEHRTAPLSPGKSIFVWMRTAEALGPDEFYPSLFQFISTKLPPNQ